MKIYFLITAFFLISACSSVRYTKSDFVGKEFEWDSSKMIGKSILRFSSDSSFVYSERDSLFICSGSWYLLNDQNAIIIESIEIPYINSDKPPFSIQLSKEFKIINLEKLQDSDLKLFRITKH